MSMGGGSSGGGTVVGGPTPAAATMAGMYQYNAANNAAQAATQATNDAINLIRSQYNNAFMALKPYTTEGIQALDQLNQYMGLQAYNPGTAPPTVDLASEKARINQDQIYNYINQHSSLTPVQDPTGGGLFLHPTYTGVGSNDPNVLKAYQQAWSGWNGTKPGGVTSMNSDSIASPQVNFGQLFTSAPNQLPGSNVGNIINNDVQTYLANQNLQNDLPTYQQQMDVYNYAKQLQGQYDAQGPMTPDQVTNKLMNQPGVQFQYNQGLDAIQRAASSKGMLGSGRLLQALSDYGQGMAQQQYGQTLDRLASLAGQGQQAAGGIANASIATGNSTGQLTANLGDTVANSFLAGGNALAQSYLAGHQQYQVIGGGQSGGGGIGSVLGGLGSLASSFSGLFG